MTYIIKDWADNRMFPEDDFPTFDDAWEFIYMNIKDEESYQDIVVEKEGE